MLRSIFEKLKFDCMFGSVQVSKMRERIRRIGRESIELYKIAVGY